MRLSRGTTEVVPSRSERFSSAVRKRKCSAGFQPAKVPLTQKELSSLHAGETPALRFFLTSCAFAVGPLVAAEGGPCVGSSGGHTGPPLRLGGTPTAIFIRSGEPQDHENSVVKTEYGSSIRKLPPN